MFVHAKTLETRWGLALAFIDLDEDDNECLKLQLWVPADGGDARCVMKVGLNSSASDDAHDAMSAANRSALENMTKDTFEKAMATAGFAVVLDEMFSPQPHTNEKEAE